MKRSSLMFIAFNLVNLLDEGVSAPAEEGRDAAIDKRTLTWLTDLAPGSPATDWTGLDPNEIAEIEDALSDLAAAVKTSKVGANNNGVAAVLGYVLDLAQRAD